MNPDDKKQGAGPQILLVNPWIYDFAAYDLWAKPLGLLYIAAVLRENGYQVSLLDCLHRRQGTGSRRTGKITYGCGKFPKEILPKPSVYSKIPRRYGRYGISEKAFGRALSAMSAPAAILVTSGMTYWYPGVFHAIRLLRARFPRSPILLGGIYATLCLAHARSFSGADKVMAGPGEALALRAVDQICGLSSEPNRYQDVTALPFPAFDLYGRPAYACLLTSRGCPFQCTYCAARLLSGKYRRRPAEAVLTELEWLTLDLGVQDIAFYDDALLVDSESHIKPILEGVVRTGLDCRFHTPNGLHVRLVDRELAHLMFRAGLKTVRLSLETADESRQNRMGPKATAEDLTRAVEHLAAAGYRRRDIGVYLLAGLPEQTEREILDSVKFVSGLGVTVKLALYSPIPGTQEWRRAVQVGLQDADVDPLLHNNSVLPTSCPQLPRERLETIKGYVREKNASLM